jgi:serine/threonine protein kinase
MRERLEKSEKYRLKRRLAIGGMGEIYLIETQNHPQFTDGILVAKGPPNEIIHNKNKIEMLNEEGRLALRLAHENIVQTFDIEKDDDEIPLLLMEYLSGPSLSEILGRAKQKEFKIPIHFILQVLKDIVCGLHFAHTLKNQYGNNIGIIHRDISPANILITIDGHNKIIDFGIAKSADSEVKTKTGTIKGKLSYMAPEHITGKRPDIQSDIWALGVVLWESLAVNRLFSGNTFQAVIQQVLHFPIVPPSTVNKKVPTSIDAICMKLLKRDQEERYANCADIFNSFNALKINWSPKKTTDLIKKLFPRKSERWLHEAERTAHLRDKKPLAKGLVEGGVCKIENIDFSESERTGTTKKAMMPFDWSEFSESTSTFTGSRSNIHVTGSTTESEPVFDIITKLPTLVKTAVKENDSYKHGFDEDPWSELTSTREIPNPNELQEAKIESDLENIMDLDEPVGNTQSYGFDKFQSQEAFSIKDEISIQTLDSIELDSLEQNTSFWARKRVKEITSISVIGIIFGFLLYFYLS